MTTPAILITGAAGRIGSLLRRELPGDAELAAFFGGPFRLKATDIVDPGPGEHADEVSTGDLADAAFVESLFADGGVAAVIHLAGYPREADWDVLLDANIRATINIWEAARRHGVDRVLYASSNHAIGFYPRSRKIDHRVTQRPDSRYGLTKVFGEELGFLYAHKFAIRSFSMRIGMFLPQPTSRRGLSNWLSLPDAVRLVKVGLTADYICETVYGVSNNARSFWDNSSAHRLGYRPQDDSEAFAHLFPGPDHPGDRWAEHFQGGPYVSNGLSAPDERLAALDRF
ncbi:MAG: NAD(P)-dependent oxidoreductase [Beijerinckiaceae bacterium]|nr:NAD(P)-dependent oxidoreductase [Beijerinckiaceae bacterium]